ncbi:MAG: elongation factor P maturation arginine rhamnosyltransferase EarP [Betaproteobacteria bacterium]
MMEKPGDARLFLFVLRESQASSIPDMSRNWDIFCRVVDNFGDAAVCWRLARQLTAKHQAAVRLWIDNLAPLHALCHEITQGLAQQNVAGITVCAWPQEWRAVATADIVVEAFGCGLPDPYVAAMAQSRPHPVWIVLEYLTAERWVSRHHGLPSPHPPTGMPRYFFFPGFERDTGGVLREDDFAERRAAFGTEAREALWRRLGFGVPSDDANVISVFCYAGAPLPALLASWENGAAPILAAIPQGKTDAVVAAHFGERGVVRAGQRLKRGNLEVRVLPFVEQPVYDELLWSCDCNFVRGEDSFVQAQWAALPLVWQAYPQEEAAHRGKVEAFLDLYCAALPQQTAGPVRNMWRAWNGAAEVSVHDAWADFRAHRVELAEHARAWAARLASGPELAATLARFGADRLKY